MLKNYSLTILVIFFVFSVSVMAQNTNDLSQTQQRVAQINESVAKLKLKTADLTGVSAEGAKTKGFFDGAQIQKATAQIYGEAGETDFQFFYHNGELVFATEDQSNYDKPFGTTVQVIRREFYFADKRLVKLTVDKKELPESDKQFNEQGARAIELSQKILANFND